MIGEGGFEMTAAFGLLIAFAEGLEAGVLALADGLGRGVLRSMAPSTALAGLFSEDGKAKLRTIGDKVSAVYSDVVLGVKY